MATVADAPKLVGTVFAAAHAILDRSPLYQSFRANDVSRGEFVRLIDTQAAELQRGGVPQGDVPFMKRFPRKPHAYAMLVVADLQRRGILPVRTCDATRLLQTERMMKDFEHGPFKTFIYPEEGLLLAAIADLARPRHAVFLGSYYGYWAHWAIPSIVAAGGRVTLIDPNAACCAIARSNLRAGGYADRVEVVETCGEEYLANTSDTYDLVVLDAENPRDHPDPDQRGKRVYHSLMRACLPRLAPAALLVCHNILFTDNSGDPAFANVIARNREELARFAGLAASHFAPFIEYCTTEGTGIGRLSAAPAAANWPIPADLDLEAT